MSAWLLKMSFGPVGSMIKAARRNRDLWAGSRLLADCVRAAALSLEQESGGKLIYPISDLLHDGHRESNVSNVLLASFASGDQGSIRQAFDKARQAAMSRLTAMGEKAKSTWLDSEPADSLRSDLFDAQIADALECYGAWTPQRTDHEGGYASAYEHLKKLFDARKATREFSQCAVDDKGVPKSSLDGLNGSVLKPKKHLQYKTIKKFALGRGEQLDALGLIKRSEDPPGRFVPLSRVAVEPWLQVLRAARAEDKSLTEALQDIEIAYGKLVATGVATKVDADLFDDMLFDAALLFPSRLSRELADLDRLIVDLKDSEFSDADARTARELIAEIQKKLIPIWKQYGHPNPYAALLVADGDKMGKFVGAAASDTEHRDISRAIAEFSEGVPSIARAHQGQAVFCGGEDLMIVMPINRLLGVAESLSQSFLSTIRPQHEAMWQRLAAEGIPESARPALPTLRVGIAICHAMEPLSQIRTYADEAESLAKGLELPKSLRGHALGLRLHLRAGHQLQARLRFDDPEAFAALRTWLAAYGSRSADVTEAPTGALTPEALEELGTAPGRLGYDLRDLIARYRRYRITEPEPLLATEFERLLIRANESGGDGKLSAPLKAALRARLQALVPAKPDAFEPYERLASELILARWLASATDLGED
ncbi:type III-B CRISPR-associated protein Cas10/Cmr2 [Ahniella affigens]|uniref:Type III-B CRISPR-associated protein Cas10/Cmr2 n=1 Tax=Ahniella affigens TaxID=2021234 RepID=A0A2P1PTP8_9GAMM|nr:type III-B CRISPR-associated protein Cas10/Cmr2 [Ahniella affigens]AVP98227.1 type III-B CRISPR-associated protein Cas10/Cmr2 [Ahniella affigens]